MAEYTITQAAARLGKAPRTIRQNVEKHGDIGRRVGAVWILSEADLVKLAALRPGRPPRKRRRAQAPAAQENQA